MKNWAHWIGRVFLTSWARSVVAWVPHPKIHARPLSCSSGCQSWYSATTRCSFSSHFVLTKIRTSSHRGYFVFSFLFLALGPYTPEGIKNNNNNTNNNNNIVCPIKLHRLSSKSELITCTRCVKKSTNSIDFPPILKGQISLLFNKYLRLLGAAIRHLDLWALKLILNSATYSSQIWSILTVLF